MIIKMQEDSNIREVFMKQHTTEYFYRLEDPRKR